MANQKNPLTWFGVCITCFAIGFALGAEPLGYQSFFHSNVGLLVGICTLTAIAWTLLEYRRGAISIMLRAGRIEEFNRKTKPIQFYLTFTLYLVTAIFLFWGVSLGGVKR